MKLIYIHGFNSSGESSKANDLRLLFPNIEIISPSLPMDPFKAIQQLEKLITQNQNFPLILIGTSLGGFYAKTLCEKWGLSGILINPSIVPHIGLQDKVGVQTNYGTGEAHEFKEEYLHTLESLYNTRPLDSSYLVLASAND
jgi:predicted esterase YcpF (UPF0227 family)